MDSYKNCDQLRFCYPQKKRARAGDLTLFGGIRVSCKHSESDNSLFMRPVVAGLSIADSYFPATTRFRV